MIPNFMTDGHDTPLTERKPMLLPADHTILGIDISRHNGDINWKEVIGHKFVNQPLHFVIIKATEGADWIDPAFKSNWDSAAINNLVRGAYHFYSAGTDPELQAINYISTVKHEKGDFVPVLDFENEDGAKHRNKQNLSKNAFRWLKIVEEQVGKKPIIYTNHLIYNKYIKGKIKGYDIWLADYSIFDPTIYDIENMIMWQHSDGGRIPGIIEDVDLNVFYGSHHKFEKYLFK